MCLSQDIATGHRKPNLLATADADDAYVDDATGAAIDDDANKQ